MTFTLEQLEEELRSSEQNDLSATVSSMMERVRSLSLQDRDVLMTRALEWSRHLPSAREQEWSPRRTLVRVVLHAAGVNVVASEEEQRLRAEVKQKLSQLNGNLEDYRSLPWVQPSMD